MKRPRPHGGAVGRWPPGNRRLEIFEAEREFIIRANLPGIDPKDVEIEVMDHTLTIKGETRRHDEDGRAICLRRELRFGPFIRSLALPRSVARNQVTMSSQDGILEIRVLKSEISGGSGGDLKAA